jgi:hypothetical protein
MYSNAVLKAVQPGNDVHVSHSTVERLNAEIQHLPATDPIEDIDTGTLPPENQQRPMTCEISGRRTMLIKREGIIIQPVETGTLSPDLQLFKVVRHLPFL